MLSNFVFVQFFYCNAFIFKVFYDASYRDTKNNNSVTFPLENGYNQVEFFLRSISQAAWDLAIIAPPDVLASLHKHRLRSLIGPRGQGSFAYVHSSHHAFPFQAATPHRPHLSPAPTASFMSQAGQACRRLSLFKTRREGRVSIVTPDGEIDPLRRHLSSRAHERSDCMFLPRVADWKVGAVYHVVSSALFKCSAFVQLSRNNHRGDELSRFRLSLRRGKWS